MASNLFTEAENSNPVLSSSSSTLSSRDSSTSTLEVFVKDSTSQTKTEDAQSSTQEEQKSNGPNANHNNVNDGDADGQGLFGPRIRGRCQRRGFLGGAATSGSSTCGSVASGPCAAGSPLRGVQRHRSLSPPVEDLNGIMNLMSSFRDADEFQDSDAGAVFVAPRDGSTHRSTRDGSTHRSARDGSTQRAASVSLPSATWTPPSLRSFGFPKELMGFLELHVVNALAPRMQAVAAIVKSDLGDLPQSWAAVPKYRRVPYGVFGFVGVYYLLVSLYAIPLVVLGFVAPAWMCRRHLPEADDNNNEGGEGGDRYEMQQWMKFWVSLSGWQLVTSLVPSFLAALVPLKILTLLLVVASLFVPWTANPSTHLFDRVLTPLLELVDGWVDGYKDVVLEGVMKHIVKNQRERRE